VGGRKISGLSHKMTVMMDTWTLPINYHYMLINYCTMIFKNNHFF